MGLSSVREPTAPPPWSGAHRIVRWSPGTEIRFEKPLSGALFIRLPMMLAILAGPAMWMAMGRRQLAQPDLAGQVVLSLVIGAVGLWLGLNNLAAVRMALPERVTFDWSSRRLRVSGLPRRGEIPFNAITAIDVSGVLLAGVRWEPGDEATDNNRIRYHYRCRLTARTSAASILSRTQSLELVQTAVFLDAPVTPMEQAVMVATELASALGVPHHVTDYPPIPI